MLDAANWVDNEEEAEEEFTEISPLLVTQRRDHHDSPTIIESLDYDRCPNEPYMQHINARCNNIIRLLELKDWIMFGIVGICTGTVAFAIDFCVKELTKLKFLFSVFEEKYSDEFLVPLLIFVAISTAYCLVAAISVVITPEAAGSGIPEIKCYLNGIRLPKVVRIKTLLCKAFGVLFSVAGGLPCGKEGPMIHSGAAIGAGLPEGLSRLIKKLGYENSYFGEHDDRLKRDFISAGAAAGVSAAFGAPLGGVLFSLEEGSSFWNQALTWKTLFCSMCSAFVLQILQSIVESGGIGISSKYAGLINFGKFTCSDGDDSCLLWGLTDLVVFIFMGALGGLLGAAFNQLNLVLTRFRFKHVNPRGRLVRVAEVLLVAIVLSSLCFTFSNTVGSCTHWNLTGLDPVINKDMLQHGNCSGGLYNDYMTLAFTSQENSIKLLFHHFNHSVNDEGQLVIPKSPTYQPLTLVVLFVTLFLAACWTYGIGVPSGLFVPSLLIGAVYGRLCGYVYQLLFISDHTSTAANSFYPGTYSLIGAAAFLGGVVRMTISLTVILIETTRNISYGLPIMLTLMVAKWVGDLFNRGLYDIHIELKHWPLLEWEAHPSWEKLSAADIMQSKMEWLSPTPTVGRLVDILKRTQHSAFPVCVYTSCSQEEREHDGCNSSLHNRSHLKLLGLVLRSQIVTLLKLEQYRNITDPKLPAISYSELTQFYPKYPDIMDITLTVAEQNCVIDVDLYMNPSPYTVSPLSPITKVFTLFRSLGLRHLIVVNNRGEVEGMITRAELQEHYIDRVYEEKEDCRASLVFSNPPAVVVVPPPATHSIQDLASRIQ